ncbi:MAG: multiple sugar transport system ATP-binding protein [Thermomicrobiales bacterium]|jgi:ABC-type sugar transport system ATPase subunit|nr:multiple sugar transport system ATP-binding protein [Thermomicrobiales bacterium]
MASVTLNGLCKQFGPVKAVDNLDLQIQDGEFVTLLGPSGCGKSTTLACIAGLEEPSEGDILFDGRVVTELSPRDRDIAMVFQDYALYPHMSVFENMAFGLRLQKLPKAAVDEQVRRVAEMLGIGGLLARRPSHLSGGQRQRVALGRAIVRNPVVFLMDEPLSNLDAALRVSTRTEIKRLQKELGTTTIFVTHDQEEAMVLSDRVAILHAGVLQQFDTPGRIYGDPVNRFVAGFIGSPKMNFISGQIEPVEGAAVFSAQDDGLRWRLPDFRLESPIPRVTLGIRPEHIALSRDGEAESIGTISLVEPVGAVTYVDLELAGLSFKVSTDPAIEFELGERVTVSPNPKRVYLFDPTTGERIRG